MTKETKKEIFEALEKKSLAITEEVALEEHEAGDYICRAAFTTVRGGTGIAFFETMILDIWEDMSVWDIRVIPQFVIADTALEETRKMVEQVNMYFPFGAFGIDFETKHMFWRVNVPVDESGSTDETASYAIKLYEKAASVVGAVYDAMEKVVTGESTFAEQEEAGTLVGQ